jgi:hypothetical protein
MPTGVNVIIVVGATCAKATAERRRAKERAPPAAKRTEVVPLIAVLST